MVFLSPGTVPLFLPPIQRYTGKNNLRIDLSFPRPTGKARAEIPTAVRARVPLSSSIGKRQSLIPGAGPERFPPAARTGREG